MRAWYGIMVVLGCGIIGGCAAPRLSMNDKELFAERPKIIEKGDRYYLRFRYGEDAFLFHPDSRIESGKLIFYLPVTTSSGWPKGRIQEDEIVGQKKISALKNGGAYWEEPENRLVKLEIVAE